RVGGLLVTMGEGRAFKAKIARINPTVVWETWKILPRYWVTALRGAAVGCLLRLPPGGATAPPFMTYGLGKRCSQNGGRFGTGEVEGVVAPETASHAAGTSALLPMLTLGIPG